jgi:RimJ/RimL family protein N-acetyltransferase
VTNEFSLVTDRIVLRRLAVSDLAEFQAYRHDEDVGRYQGWLAQSDDDAATFLEEKGGSEFFQPGKWFQIGIADRETDALIGDIGLCLSTNEPEIEFGFSLCRQSQGQGLASEALVSLIGYLRDETKIERLVGITDTRNTASIRLLENLGMQRLRTEKAMFRGAPCEEHVFGLDFERTE